MHFHRSLRAWSRAVSASLFLLLAPTSVLAAAPYEMGPIDARNRFACVRGVNESFVLSKTVLGASRRRTFSGIRKMLIARSGRVETRLAELEAEPSTPEVDAAIAKLRKQKAWLQAVSWGVSDCGALKPFPSHLSFAFLCRFAFFAPSVATRHECSLNLGAVHQNTGPDSLGPSSWNVEDTGLLVDWVLGEACARSGGILLRNTTLSAGAPLYNAYCAKLGKRVATHHAGDTLVLGMEEEPTGPCIRAILTQNDVDDGCGDYRPGPGTNGGGGGGGSDTPPSRDPGDCVILQMEEEPTGCE